MITDEQLKAYILARPGIAVHQVRSNLKGTPSVRIREVMESIKTAAPLMSTRPVSLRKATKPLKDLLAAFDDVGKVQKALRALSKSEYMEDDEMRRSLNISLDRWREVREHPSLARFRFLLPPASKSRYVWLHPEGQAELQAAINLSST
jgi:hypothetical protein